MPPKKGLKKGAAGYKMAPKLPNGTVLQVVKYPCHICDSYLYNQRLPQASSCNIFQDMSKRKWTLTGTVGSGGFGLIYFAEEQVELVSKLKTAKVQI